MKQKRRDLRASPLDNIDVKTLDPSLRSKLQKRDYDGFYLDTLDEKDGLYKKQMELFGESDQ